jgi:hypothetical protein
MTNGSQGTRFMVSNLVSKGGGFLSRHTIELGKFCETIPKWCLRLVYTLFDNPVSFSTFQRAERSQNRIEYGFAPES